MIYIKDFEFLTSMAEQKTGEPPKQKRVYVLVKKANNGNDLYECGGRYYRLYIRTKIIKHKDGTVKSISCKQYQPVYFKKDPTEPFKKEKSQLDEGFITLYRDLKAMELTQKDLITIKKFAYHLSIDNTERKAQPKQQENKNDNNGSQLLETGSTRNNEYSTGDNSPCTTDSGEDTDESRGTFDETGSTSDTQECIKFTTEEFS